MAMSISELVRLQQLELRMNQLEGSEPASADGRIAVLEQQVTALALEIQELTARINTIEARKKPGPKPKAHNATETDD